MVAILQVKELEDLIIKGDTSKVFKFSFMLPFSGK